VHRRRPQRQGAGLRLGTIKVLARRQIETYSKLFHTVDHVEGILRPGLTADAF
jgi:anthranilate synthase